MTNATVEIWIGSTAGDAPRLAYTTTDLHLEAPNWSADGDSLYLNGDGRFWRLDLGDTVTLHEVLFDGLPPINNDHVPDPERGLIYFSANDGHIYAAPIGGGHAERVTSDDAWHHFLHGVSPDGSTLAFVAIPRGDFKVPGKLAVISSTGGEMRFPYEIRGHLDGPEYSGDGAYLYFNTEHFTSEPGHAQLARIPVAGGDVERLVTSDRVDWFPHLSPDGRYATYLSFPAGTIGHPADKPVELRLVETGDWSRTIRSIAFQGGQGTINVNSWAPDSTRFGYVVYPKPT
jgi:Tol biopolymer transport system component